MTLWYITVCNNILLCCYSPSPCCLLFFPFSHSSSPLSPHTPLPSPSPLVSCSFPPILLLPLLSFCLFLPSLHPSLLLPLPSPSSFSLFLLPPPSPSSLSLLLSKVPDDVDQRPSKVLHWGGGKKEGSALAGPQNSETLVEFGAKQIVASDKHHVMLTMSGLVYSLQAKSSGEYSATVSNCKSTVA